MIGLSWGERGSGWQYVNNLFLLGAPHAKLNLSFDFRKQRVVPAHAYIVASMNARPALPHNDASRCDDLATEAFHAQAFCVGIAAIARTPTCFFVCHESCSFFLNHRTRQQSCVTCPRSSADRTTQADCVLRAELRVDTGYLNFCVALTVPLVLLVVLAPAQLENSDLFSAAVGQDFCLNRCASE